MATNDTTETKVVLDLRITKEDIIERHIENHYNDLKKTAASFKRTILTPWFKSFEAKCDDLNKRFTEWFDKTYEPVLESIKTTFLTGKEITGRLYMDHPTLGSPTVSKLVDPMDKDYGSRTYGICCFSKEDITKTNKWFVSINDDPKYIYTHNCLVFSITPNDELKALLEEAIKLSDEAKTYMTSTEVKRYHKLLDQVNGYPEWKKGADDRWRSRNAEYWQNYAADIKGQIVNKLTEELVSERLGSLEIKTKKIPALCSLPELDEVEEELLGD